MKEIKVDKNTVSYCGLYCGACSRYLKDKCSGCKKNDKLSWCSVRKCCIKNGYMSCSDCKVHATVAECKTFNNIFARLFQFIFGSDRRASIEMIKEKGYDFYAMEMAKRKTHTIKKKK